MIDPYLKTTLAERLALIRESPVSAKPLPNIYEQAYSAREINTLGALSVILFCSVVLMGFWVKHNARNARQILHSLAQTKLVKLESSPNWGVLLPNKNGQISVKLDSFVIEFVEVIAPRLGLHRKLELTKEKWQLNELMILPVDSSIGKIQSDIAVVIQQKLELQADLEELTIYAQKAKGMYELVEGFESDPEIVQTYKGLYLQKLELISQVNVSQTLQDKHIKELLLFLEIIKFDKENIAINCSKYQVATTEIKEKYLEFVDCIKEYLKLSNFRF